MSSTVFYQMPKALFSPAYQGLTSDSIMLYTILRDRHQLSLKNGKKWRDSNGVFIFFPRKAIANLMHKSVPTILKAIRQLLAFGLLKEKRQGLTHANKLYVQLLPGEKEADLPPSKKQGFSTDKKPSSANNTEKSVYPKEGYPTTPKTRKPAVLAQQYTQRQYTRAELDRLIAVI